MNLQQTAALLLDKPGSLAYLLIVAMSLAILYSLAHVLRREQASLSRWILVSTLLLVVYLILMALTSLSWFGWVDQRILPPYNRLASLYGLLLLTSAFLFRTEKGMRRFILLASLVSLILFSLSLAAAMQLDSTTAFNHTWMDAVWSFTSLAAGVVLLIVVILSRPALWPFILLPLSLLTTGFGMHLIHGSVHSSMTAFVRLAEICAYPLYVIVASRKFAREISPDTMDHPQTDEQPAWAGLLDSIEKLNAAGNDEFRLDLIVEIAKAMTKAFNADICLVLTSPGKDGRFAIAAGYNHIQKREVPEATLSAGDTPNLHQAMVQKKSFLVKDARNLSDTYALEKRLRRSIQGSLLFAPFFIENQVFGGAILLTPVQRSDWTERDQKSLEVLANLIAQRLKRLTEQEDNPPSFADLSEKTRAEIEADIEQLREIMENVSDTTRSYKEKKEEILEKYRSSQIQLFQMKSQITDLKIKIKEAGEQVHHSSEELRTLQQQYTQSARYLHEQREENNKLREVMTAAGYSPDDYENIDAAAAEFADASARLRDLEAEHKHLRRELQKAQDQIGVDLEAKEKLKEQYDTAQQQIRLLEEEVLSLKAALSEAELEAREKSEEQLGMLKLVLQELADTRTNLFDLQFRHDARSHIQQDLIRDYSLLMQNLEKPLASMKGYAGLLMGDSVGMLGTMQRKFLERIQGSLDDISTVLQEQPDREGHNGSASGHLQGIDLKESIERVTGILEQEKKSRNLTINFSVPGNLPGIRFRQDDLESVLNLLLLNIMMTAETDGTVSINAVPRRYEQKDHILLSISTETGSDPETQPVHSNSTAGEGSSDQEELNLSDVDKFCEQYGGKFWNRKDGHGAAVSILLPVSQDLEPVKAEPVHEPA